MGWTQGRQMGSVAIAALVLAGCTGLIDQERRERAPDRPPELSSSEAAAVTSIGVRRLSRDELARTLRYALELDSVDVSSVPGDATAPFDNDYTEQQPSTALVVGIDQLSKVTAIAALPDIATLEQLGACEGAACPRALAERVGRRLLRRPLSESELDRFAQLADTDSDVLEGSRLLLRALLHDVELYYRFEGERPESGDVLAIDDFEVASRLSFLLWGSGPDDALLDRAEAGELRDSESIAAQADRMFDDPRARRQIERFHEMWLGYRDIDAPTALAEMFREETNALVGRVVFGDRAPWLDLLTARESYLTPELADHYGIDGVTEAGFHAVGEGRAGILAHGSFLANGRVRGDSSPTRRGEFVRARLMCQEIQLPVDLMVDVDEPPSANGCKPERYSEHASGACAGCHSLMDPIGFGLEHYDLTGRYRTMEAPGMDGEGNPYPECEIVGEGEVTPLGTFSGPRELGALLRESEVVQECAATQFFRFATGRHEREDDSATLETLRDTLGSDGTLIDLILAYVGSESFLYRKVD
ncbi:MAG: DUF1592 domain-containing protein [Myxococcota bacterium]